MCWILVKKAENELNTEYMDKAQKYNKDGYGVAWFENGYVNTYKTFNYPQFRSVCKALEGNTLVIHMRNTTKGDTTFENIHPFDIPSGVMFHNGTMFKAPSHQTKSDSQMLAKLIGKCNYEAIEDIAPLIEPYIDDKINRLVFFEDTGKITIMNDGLGIYENGDWYSNDYHTKDEGWCRTGSACTQKKLPPSDNLDTTTYHLVFVYGTLKKGGHNHSKFLGTATFVGKANTAQKYAMIGKYKSFPYLLCEDADKGGLIEGEVYSVTDRQLKMLDSLEGVPTHYKRSVIEVNMENGSKRYVNVYMKTTITLRDLTEELITNWEV